MKNFTLSISRNELFLRYCAHARVYFRFDTYPEPESLVRRFNNMVACLEVGDWGPTSPTCLATFRRN